MAKEFDWIKFYPDDWNGDPELATCSLSAQGFLARLMAVLHRSATYGYLLVNGSEPPPRDLSKALGIAPNTCRACLKELENRGVLKRDKVGLYSKRMVIDQQKREAAQEAGRKGGNPELLKGGVKGGVKHRVKPELRRRKKKEEGEYTPAFLHFWKEYPRKTEKQKAFRAWKARMAEDVLTADLIRAATLYAKSSNGTETKFIKYPATFLGPDRHWEEVLEAAKEPEKPKLKLPDCPICDNNRLRYIDPQKPELGCVQCECVAKEEVA